MSDTQMRCPRTSAPHCGSSSNASSVSKYGYPPDKQEKATQTVLEQAEVLSEMWANL
jgi:hypothetical protein